MRTAVFLDKDQTHPKPIAGTSVAQARQARLGDLIRLALCLWPQVTHEKEKSSAAYTEAD
jgi:hypothetical protein